MLIDRLAALTGIAVITLFMAAPANALTMAECSTKYNAAKDAGTLDGQSWNQFRKAECGTDASATATETKASKKTAKASDAAKSDDAAGAGLTMAECSAKYQSAKDAGTLNGAKWNDFRKTECAAGASTEAATAKPAKATKSASTAKSDDAAGTGLTMAECSAKYQAAKDAGTLNGAKWNDFRKTECAAGASASATAKPAKAAKNSIEKADASAKGLSMADCSAKYQAAKSDGSLGGVKWNDFRKAQCGANAADDDTVPAADEASYTNDPETPTVKAPRGVKFPSSILKKFASETPGKARLHTCLDGYYANKDADTLNGLRWIQKGGGYYSLCNAKLKS